MIRRRMYALFRKRFREIMKLRREVKVREHAGHYTTRAKIEVLNSYFLPDSITTNTKRLTIMGLIDVIFISVATMLTPTAAMNTMMNAISSQMNGLWLVYWVPTILYLLSIIVAFSYGMRAVVSLPTLCITGAFFMTAYCECLSGLHILCLAFKCTHSLFYWWQIISECLR